MSEESLHTEGGGRSEVGRKGLVISAGEVKKRFGRGQIQLVVRSLRKLEC